MTRSSFFFFSIVGSGVRTRWLVFPFYFHIHLVDWRMGLSFKFFFFFSLTQWFDIQEEVKVLGPFFFHIIISFPISYCMHGHWNTKGRPQIDTGSLLGLATEDNEGALRAWIWLERMMAVGLG